MKRTEFYQTRKGILMKEGFYLATNPRTGKVNVISVSGDEVYIHDVTRKTTLKQLVYLDSVGLLDIFAELKLEQKK